jgi:hypothetical protein
MTQAVSHRPLNAEALIRVISCGICGGQSGTGTGFSESFGSSLTISFHLGSPYAYISFGMNNRPVSSRSSETWSRPIDMNKNIYDSYSATSIISKCVYNINFTFEFPFINYCHHTKHYSYQQ